MKPLKEQLMIDLITVTAEAVHRQCAFAKPLAYAGQDFGTETEDGAGGGRGPPSRRGVQCC